MSIQVYCGDCLAVLPTLPDKSIDMVLCDLPYAVTQNAWDSLVPLEPLWKEYKRVVRPGCAIVLTAQIPFSIVLGMSNLAWLKYEWIWEKTQASGFLNAYVMPLRKHENILVFGDGKVKYNPIIVDKPVENIRGRDGEQDRNPSSNYGAVAATAKRLLPISKTMPTTILRVANVQGGIHPTQKPVELLEYLIRTYTDSADIVLDNCMGSGSTGEACLRSGRSFIGIEKDQTYFDAAKQRLSLVTPGLF